MPIHMREVSLYLKKSLKQSGFTLIEIMIGLGTILISSIVISSMIAQVKKTKGQLDLVRVMVEARDQLNRTIQSPTMWAKTIQMNSQTLSSGMSCLAVGCADIGWHEFKLYNEIGNEVKLGRLGYSFQLQWQPLCENYPCKNPSAQVLGILLVPKDYILNSEKYQISLIRNFEAGNATNLCQNIGGILDPMTQKCIMPYAGKSCLSGSPNFQVVKSINPLNLAQPITCGSLYSNGPTCTNSNLQVMTQINGLMQSVCVNKVCCDKTMTFRFCTTNPTAQYQNACGQVDLRDDPGNCPVSTTTTIPACPNWILCPDGINWNNLCDGTSCPGPTTTSTTVFGGGGGPTTIATSTTLGPPCTAHEFGGVVDVNENMSSSHCGGWDGTGVAGAQDIGKVYCEYASRGCGSGTCQCYRNLTGNIKSDGTCSVKDIGSAATPPNSSACYVTTPGCSHSATIQCPAYAPNAFNFVDIGDGNSHRIITGTNFCTAEEGTNNRGSCGCRMQCK
jgi:Tfp pilus assembly protein PilV